MTLMEGLVVAAGVPAGYWLVRFLFGAKSAARDEPVAAPAPAGQEAPPVPEAKPEAGGDDGAPR
jgi:hypothetical protein